MAVRDRDLGWERIKRELKNLDKSYTKVGLPEDGTVAPPRGAVREGEEVVTEMSDLVIVGAANEFGTKRIPERSFLRTATDESKQNISRLQEKIYGKLLTVEITVKEGLSMLGEYLTGKVRNKIVAIKLPPNAPSTLKKKFPKTNPLIDKAQLVQSIQHQEVVSGGIDT